MILKVDAKGGDSTADQVNTAQTRLRRGRVLSFSSVDWTCVAQLDGSIGSVTVAVGDWVNPATMVADAKVAVLLFDDNNPNDGVVMGTYGGAMRGANPAAIDVVTAETEVVSNAAETALLTYSVPANTLGTNNALLLEAWISYLNNSGISEATNLRLKYGGTTLVTFANTNTTNATRRLIHIRAMLKADASASAQRMTADMLIALANGSSAGGSTTGEGTAAIDSTAAQDLVLTVDHVAADANVSAIIRMSTVELRKAL